jgi:N-acetylglucosamine-6-phosphate deacetylase
LGQFALTKGALLTPFNLIEEATILINGSKIVASGPADMINIPSGYREIPLDGFLIAPGFIDPHLHGGGGAAVMEGTPDSLAEIARFHATHGTTAFLASTTSGFINQLETTARAFATFSASGYKGAKCLGLHLEGPYLSPKFAGAHSLNTLRNPSLAEIMDIHRLSNSGVKMVTMAPELPDALKIAPALVNEGILCSIGHSDADYDITLAAILAGFTGVTHCYNQLPPFHHREPGVLGAALTRNELSVEIIVDGIHLHRAAVDLIWRAKGTDGIMLVSDAMAPTGLPDGTYQTPDGTLTLTKGLLKDSNGKLAGSALTLERAIKNLLNFTNCQLTDAFRMATYNPAKFLGINKRKGSLYPGKDADIVALTLDLEVVMTMVEGEIISGLISLD